MSIVSVKKIGGSLYVRLPFPFRHKFGLKEGDRYEPIPNADGSIIKLVKADDELVEQKQDTAVDAA
jgi:bifunctional DNA-binding transcriptional regulator/antitoxin component of YhaV-PrlF toxin-antitoxin module